MIGFSSIAAKVTKIVADNSPLILTAIGATGVLSTAYFTAKGTQLAIQKIQEAENDPATAKLPLDNMDKFKLVWINYLPAAGSAALSITAIIFANRISSGRAAALAAAVVYANNDLDEYKEKVKEKLGVSKESKLSDEIVKDRVANNPGGSQIILAGADEVLCYDVYSDRYFKMTMQSIHASEMNMQQQLLSQDHVTVADWYVQVGLKRRPGDDELGWNHEKPFNLAITLTEAEDGRACYAIAFRTTPVRKPLKTH